ncbi:MAG: AMP-binding protein [Clostridiales Family XIII bacterium]|jgi:long-chain acyl-CoA synthetase|nr:AMP-binding protein [Clostridiales Family XIII bacterium]
MKVYQMAEESALRANKTALVLDELTFDSLRLVQDAGRLGDALRQHVNPAPPHAGTVFIYGASVSFQLLCFLAAQKHGFVPVILHPSMPESRIGPFMRDSHACALLTEQPLSEGRGIALDCPDGSFYLYGIPPDGTRTAGISAPGTRRIQEDGIFGVLTSGSTGFPKILLRTCCSWADFFAEQNAVFQIDRSSVVYFHGSLSFTGNLNMCLAVLSAGGSLISTTGLYVRGALRFMEKHHANGIYLVPSKLQPLAKAAGENPDIRCVVAGSQRMDEALVLGLRRVFPSAEILLYYGASELNYVSCISAEDLLARPGSVGRPFRGVSVTAEDGAIRVDTPFGAEGLAMPFQTGDAGHFDRDGYLYFDGRLDETLNMGGVKVSLPYVREEINRLAEVEDCAVIPLPLRSGKVAAAAFIVLKDAYKDTSADGIRAKLCQRLMPAEIPQKITFRDSLPRNESGKIDRAALLGEL